MLDFRRALFAVLTLFVATDMAAAGEKNAPAEQPSFRFAVVGGVNEDFQRGAGIPGALPTETVEKILSAHPASETMGEPIVPPGADARITGNIAGLKLQRGKRLARIKLSGLQGRDVPTGPMTRELVSDMGVDGLLITLPALTGPDSLSTLHTAAALVKSYEEAGLFSTLNRVLLAHGSEHLDELKAAAKTMRARLVIISKPADYRVVMQELADAALRRGPAPK